MPKMKDEYLEAQRNKILDAAFTVCMRKPLHQVSMRDVIVETGFSQGNIYRYFPNLEAILIALPCRDNTIGKIPALVDATLAQDEIPEIVIRNIFDIYDKKVLESLVGIGKIYFEMQQFLVYDFPRYQRFMEENPGMQDENYLKQKAMAYVNQKIEEGYFHPKLSPQELMSFLVVSLDGAIRDLIFVKHYGIPFPSKLDEDSLMQNIATAFIMLLGGDEKLGV